MKLQLLIAVALSSARAFACDYTAGIGTYVARAPSGARLATVSAQSATYELGDRARVALETSEATLRVVQTADDFSLHATRAFTMGGWLVPERWLDLRWLGGNLVVQPKTLPRVHVGALPQMTVACADASLDDSGPIVGWQGNAKAALGRSLEAGGILRKGPIAFSRTVDGPVVFTLDADDTSSAALLESRGDRIRVATPIDRAVVFGWIDRKHFWPNMGAGASGGTGEGYSSGDRGGVRGTPHVTCADHTPLTVTLAGKRFEIGSLHANISARVVGKAGDRLEIELDSVRLVEGARLSVAAASCPQAP